MKTTVEIKKMGINGEGIGYINRKIVFIKGALLNEEVLMPNNTIIKIIILVI